MSPLNLRNTTFLAAAATLVGFVNPASAFDFSKPADKRVYCQVYARQALNDVRTVTARGCGFSGISWSSSFDEHFNWCMGQSDVGAPTQENLTRSSAVEQCSGGQNEFPPIAVDTAQETAASFPPVVAEAPAEQASTFPPVVADDPAPASSEGATTQSTSFPPVEQSTSKSSSQSSTSAHASHASFPPVVDTGEATTDADVGDVSTSDPIADRREEIRAAAERLIEFGREHEDEIREVAHNLKEKIKRKLSEIKEHHDNDGDDQVADTLKSKIKEKLSSLKDHHQSKHSDQMGDKLKGKIKQKLSELKQRHGNHHGQAEHSLKSKVKNALKGGLMRRLANR